MSVLSAVGLTLLHWQTSRLVCQHAMAGPTLSTMQASLRILLLGEAWVTVMNQLTRT